MLPLDFPGLGPWGFWFLNLAIGMGFGAVLEASGFGDSRRLAAQFYGRDMTVLKVMFGAIITAATLIVLGSALGLVDFARMYVNYTYLWPQIAGGLTMGVGFIVGGFCPGTSVVAASTLKVDGLVFLLGVVSGIYLFGECVQGFEPFYESGALGRFTLADWLGIDLGWALVGVVSMALLMFWGGEVAEALLGRGETWKGLRLLPHRPVKLAAAGLVMAAALAAALRGQPDAAGRWRQAAPKAQQELDRREPFVDPYEVLELLKNPAMNVALLDLRSEADFNVFHLKGAWNLAPGALAGRPAQRRLAALPENSVVFLMAEQEGPAVEGWKLLRGLRVPNVYVLEGGLRRWLRLFPPEPCVAEERPGPEGPTYRFLRSVGEHSWAAHPQCACRGEDEPCGRGLAHAEPAQPPAFVHKVKVTVTGAKKGGCG